MIFLHIQVKSRPQIAPVARSPALSSACVQEALLIPGPISLSKLSRPQAFGKRLSFRDADPCFLNSNDPDQGGGPQKYSFESGTDAPRPPKHPIQIDAFETKCQRGQ